MAAIAEQDSVYRAWVQVKPDRRAWAPGEGGLLALAGIPFGAKDIIETDGLATEYGSPVYAGRIGTSDAAIVRLLRDRGGVLMGKTQTTAFAWRTPSPTRNPRNPAHTPGGSSSGSAAAVALGMVPFALGTQTLGSIIRPASFCGVTGFKPTYGVLPMEGVLPCAPSLDTLGLFTRTAADMSALWSALWGPTSAGPTSHPADAATTCGAIDPLPDVDPGMAAAFATSVETLRRAGVRVRPVDIRARLGSVARAARVVLATEAARVHEARYREYGDRLQDMADLVREGLATPAADYDEALRTIAAARIWIDGMFADTPVILTPAALGAAPHGLSATGDPAMNAPWTALGTPAVTMPMPGDGLPLGLQLTAASGQDVMLLRTAARAERIMGSGVIC